jgi:lipoprotein-releasing system permease protein
MLGVAVGTMALVIVLSVFNGLEDLIQELNQNFDPELKVEAAKGKSFECTKELLERVKATEGVKIVTAASSSTNLHWMILRSIR